MTEHAILVLGSTGTVGRRLVARLADLGAPVRAASRRGDVRFDWSEPPTWAPALDGSDRLFVLAPDGVPVDPAFVAQAVESGVRRIVLLSSRGIEAMDDRRLLDAEAVVRGSGAEWTIVRADWFDQNFDEGFFRPAILAGELAMPLGEHRQAFVDAGDIAAVAAAALTSDGHGGRRYDVTGPRPLTFGEAAEIIGRVSGRTVRYRGSAEEYIAQQEALGEPREAAEGAVAVFAALRAAGEEGPTDDVLRVTGQPPLPFETYAAGAAAAGAWD
ncbi:NAD(P)H-binding protein [Jiangella anatolica]|uniref:NmrA family transcriptional regulator n=1 Tax=Jiangella anatolica TaxID=2670374 RepID=A0A2W2CMI8_9ACTN|nr:NAD(P)H-binding protein [Jiangella anatolica]PZF81413.1 NmrA family transcriptional regulator [Jiangella anatolica]